MRRSKNTPKSALGVDVNPYRDYTYDGAVGGSPPFCWLVGHLNPWHHLDLAMALGALTVHCRTDRSLRSTFKMNAFPVQTKT